MWSEAYYLAVADMDTEECPSQRPVRNILACIQSKLGQQCSVTHLECGTG